MKSIALIVLSVLPLRLLSHWSEVITDPIVRLAAIRSCLYPHVCRAYLGRGKLLSFARIRLHASSSTQTCRSRVKYICKRGSEAKKNHEVIVQDEDLQQLHWRERDEWYTAI